MEKDMAQLDHGIASLDKEIINIKSDLDKNRADISRLQVEANSQALAYDTFRRELEAGYSSFREATSGYAMALGHTRSLLQDRDNIGKEQEKTLNHLEQQLSDLTQKYLAERSEHIEIKGQLDQHVAHYNNLMSRADALNQQKTDANKLLAAYTRKIEVLDSCLASIDTSSADTTTMYQQISNEDLTNKPDGFDQLDGESKNRIITLISDEIARRSNEDHPPFQPVWFLDSHVDYATLALPQLIAEPKGFDNMSIDQQQYLVDQAQNEIERRNDSTPPVQKITYPEWFYAV